jgi:hypothetical protein
MKTILLATLAALLASLPAWAVDLAPPDPVIGVTLGGVPRAYPLASFVVAPVVNDEVGRLSVVVFYDRENDVALAWFRMIGGESLEFSGRAAGTVADDLTTATRWDLASGQAVSGSLTGQKLVPIPVKRLPYEDWRKAHPKGTLFGP